MGMNWLRKAHIASVSALAMSPLILFLYWMVCAATYEWDPSNKLRDPRLSFS